VTEPVACSHGTERNHPPYCGRVPISRWHGAPLRLAVCVEHTEQWPARADRTRFAAVGVGRFRPAIGRRSLRQPKPLCLGVGELRPRQPIRRATSSRLSPAARRRTRAPASRSAIKRTIGSGCAASIAAASVIGSLIGHSARGGSTTTTEKFRQRLPRSGALSARIASGLRRTHGGGGSRLAFGLASQPWWCLQWLGSCGLPWPALPRGVRGGSPTLRGLPKAEPNLISSRPSQMTGL